VPGVEGAREPHLLLAPGRYGARSMLTNRSRWSRVDSFHVRFKSLQHAGVGTNTWLLDSEYATLFFSSTPTAGMTTCDSPCPSLGTDAWMRDKDAWMLDTDASGSFILGVCRGATLRLDIWNALIVVLLVARTPKIQVSNGTRVPQYLYD
jgi:hypothetical protein